ncbi:MAG: SCP2 sterol-binding domain-containing protein [Haloechinothrix sp.]
MRALAFRNGPAPVVSGGELDALAGAIDLSKLGPAEFIQLLEALHMLGEYRSGVQLGDMRTDTLVQLVARASKDQLRALSGHGVLRPFFVDEIFRRMSEHLIQGKVKDLSLVVSWRFTEGRGEDGYDRYQTVIEDGLCVSAEDLGRIPDTTVTLSAYDFIRMATGVAAVAPMFITGKVKVKGDYSLAAMFSSYFDIPKPV